MSVVAAGFFSFTEVTRADEHRAYNEWHMLDHMPEQYTLPGIVWGERWVSTPACRAARSASRPPLDAIHYVTLYLVAPPIDESLVDFFGLGQELRDKDRFHQHREAHLTGVHDVLVQSAAARVLVSAASIPFRPHLGVHVRVDAEVDEGWLTGRHVNDLVDVPGVAGVWVFRRRPGPSDARYPDAPPYVTLAWLDGPPLFAAQAIAALPDEGAPVFEGPLERVEVHQWAWFDAEGGAPR